MNIPKPVALLLALAALAYFKPWEKGLPSPTPNGDTPWITPYTAPADPSALNAIRAEAKRASEMSGHLAGMYQVFGDMVQGGSNVIRSGADVRKAAEMATKLMGTKPANFPAALLNRGGTLGLVDQYVLKQAGVDENGQRVFPSGALTDQQRRALATAYRDVAWALEQES